MRGSPSGEKGIAESVGTSLSLIWRGRRDSNPRLHVAGAQDNALYQRLLPLRDRRSGQKWNPPTWVAAQPANHQVSRPEPLARLATFSG